MCNNFLRFDSVIHNTYLTLSHVMLHCIAYTKRSPDSHELHVDNPKMKGIYKIDIDKITQIRRYDEALRCNEFMLGSDSKKAQETPEYAIAIMHGDQFKLKQLCFIVNNEEEFDAWTEGLEQLLVLHSPELHTSDMATMRYLHKEWNYMTAGRDAMTARDFKVFLSRANLKLSAREIRDAFDSVDTYHEGQFFCYTVKKGVLDQVLH